MEASAKKQVPLRLSPELYNELAKWAEEDYRSVNAQIEYLLNESLKNHKILTSGGEMPGFSHLKGYHGVARSNLHPTGRAYIDGMNYDVLAEGEFVTAGTEIVVTDVQGNRITVMSATRLKELE